jgi:hypothetical protein
MLPCDHSVTGHVAIGPGYHVGGSMLAWDHTTTRPCCHKNLLPRHHTAFRAATTLPARECCITLPCCQLPP